MAAVCSAKGAAATSFDDFVKHPLVENGEVAFGQHPVEGMGHASHEIEEGQSVQLDPTVWDNSPSGSSRIRIHFVAAKSVAALRKSS